MSKETLFYFKNLDIKNIETQIALQCAPLITGLKISNLLIVPNHQREQVMSILSKTKISCFFIYASCEKSTFLLYDENKVNAYIKEGVALDLFKELGHEKVDLAGMLDFVRGRYVEFAKGECEFPHELGLILGYPAEDVHGFIENQGKNALCAGYWKVYSNLPEKSKVFRLFDLAKNKVIKLLARGMSIDQVIGLYSA